MAIPPDAAVRQAEQVVLMIVGGNFTPDALGPEEHRRILARLRADPRTHLDAFERLFLRGRPDSRAQSRLHLPNLLRLLGDVAPDRVRALAGRLLGQYDAAMSLADEAPEGRERLLEALPEESRRAAQRLDMRRRELRGLLSGGEGGRR